MPPKRTSSSIASFGRGAKASSASSVAQAAQAAQAKSKSKSNSTATPSAAAAKPVQTKLFSTNEGKPNAPRSSSTTTAAAVVTAGSRASNPTERQLLEEKARGRPELDVDDPGYDELWEHTKKRIGYERCKPVHSQDYDRIQHMLRAFDLDPSYGPASGMTRLERWYRAKDLGEEPPEEIRHILETRQGILESGLRDSYLSSSGVPGVV